MKKIASVILIFMMVSIGLMGTFVFLPGETGAAGSGDSPWPMLYGNARHTGQSSYYISSLSGIPIWRYVARDDGISSPAIGSDGTVYFGSNDGNLYALNPDGTLKWNYTTGDTANSSPAIGSDGTIYIGSWNGNVYALNPDGTLKWKYATGEGVIYSIDSSPAIDSDGTIYIASEEGKVYAINPDGTLKWSCSTEKNIQVNTSPAIGSDGTVYVGANNWKAYALNADGTLKWNYSASDDLSSPAIGGDGTIYFGSDDHNVYALNPDGTLKWKYTTGSWVKSPPAIGGDGTIYIGSYDNNLYAFGPDGTMKWNHTTEETLAQSPVIGADGSIYVVGGMGSLYAFGSDGTLKWSKLLDLATFSAPAIAADGTVYLSELDSREVLAFRGTSVPGAPRELRAVASEGAVSLNWSAPDNDGGSPITNYKIYRGDSSGAEILLTTVADILSFSDTAVTNGQTYYYRVSAVNAIGEGLESNEASATSSAGQSDTTVPSSPLNLQAFSGDCYANLSWSTPADDGGSPIINYKIYRGDSSGGEILLTTVGNVFHYTDTALTNGQTYYYKVSAVNAVGEGALSEEISVTPNNTSASGAVSDSDHDGLPDSWEQEHFGNLNQGPEDDYDADGYTNLKEYQENTDPTDSKDYPSKKSSGPKWEMATFILIVGAIVLVTDILSWKKRKSLSPQARQLSRQPPKHPPEQE